MRQFDNSHDLELWTRASKGDLAAEEQLVSEYSVLVRICARPYFLAGGDSEDLIQEGMIGLLSAVRHFDAQRDVRFRTYAEVCIRRRIYDAIELASRGKNTPLNDYVPLESTKFDEKLTPALYNLREPEDLLIAKEWSDELRDVMNSVQLSRLESQIMALFLEGMSYEEMAQIVGKTTKSVDNAVQRIRKKLSQRIKNSDYSVD